MNPEVCETFSFVYSFWQILQSCLAWRDKIALCDITLLVSCTFHPTSNGSNFQLKDVLSKTGPDPAAILTYKYFLWELHRREREKKNSKSLNPNEQHKIFLSAVELKYLCHLYKGRNDEISWTPGRLIDFQAAPSSIQELAGATNLFSGAVLITGVPHSQ